MCSKSYNIVIPYTLEMGILKVHAAVQTLTMLEGIIKSTPPYIIIFVSKVKMLQELCVCMPLCII